MNYQQALDYLYSFLDSERKLPRTPLDFNLPRTAALLHAVGDPQQHFRSVVVAGTKGKGSTCAMIESILRSAGYHTGLWSSPHLHSYRERIQFDRMLILQETFTQLVERWRPVFDLFDTERYGAPTTFDIGFALALRAFADRGVQVAVLEVGLGGRYDSANAVTPLLSVVTSISYDHTDVLGKTLAEIAYQKAGIFKPGVPAVTLPQQPEAMAVIEQVAAETGTPLCVAPSPAFDPLEHYHGPVATPLLPGRFQQENARLAVGAALLLRRAGLEIPDDAIGAGLAATRWPGRLEIVPGEPTIVLDGAHNGDSARKLVASLEELYPGRRIVLVLGTMRDKDLERITAALVPHAGALVLTHSYHPRALLDLDRLAAAAAPYLPAEPIPVVRTVDVGPALEEARRLAQPGDLIVVTGSLAIVAGAREALGLPNERD